MYYYFIATGFVGSASSTLLERNDLLEIVDINGAYIFNRYAYFNKSQNFRFTSLLSTSVCTIKEYYKEHPESLVLIKMSETRDSRWVSYSK
jgi:hypothetical protein